MAQVFLGGHAEAGFELSQKTTQRKIGCASEGADSDVLPKVLVKEVEGWPEFFILAHRSGSLFEGTSNSDNAANLPVLIKKWLLGRGGPIDESIATWDKLDAVGDRFPSLDDFQIIGANVLEDVDRNVVVVFLAEDFIGVGGIKDFYQTLVVSDVFEFTVFDEVDKAWQVVKDGGKMVLDLMILKEAVVLHSEDRYKL